MIKQGLVQEAVAELGGPAPLPPLNNLPQWSRVNTLDKARYPKPFPRDRLQPLGVGGLESPESLGSAGQSPGGSAGSGAGGPDLEIPDNMNAAQRVQHLERSIRFLSHQHTEILANLHDEIERLKRANKELQFRLVIMQKGISPPDSPQKHHKSEKMVHPTAHKSTVQHTAPTPYRSVKETSSASSSRSRKPLDPIERVDPQIGSSSHLGGNYTVSEPVGSQGTEDDFKLIFLEEEIKELKKTLKEERLRNNYLTQLMEQAQKLKVQPQSDALLEDGTGVIAHAGRDLEQRPVEELKLPYGATVSPLQVHLPAHQPRPPTLAECEVIIKHMQETNERQAHELNQLKSDLRDVLYSHKWTPDAFLLAKAYVAEDDAREDAERHRLPRIQLRQQTRKLPDIAYINRDAVMLPALKTTLGNQAIERRKRAQILQKARMKREVNSASAKA